MLYPIEYAVMKILYLTQGDAVDITKSDLADYLGITLRSVNRALSSLGAKGILRFSENSFSIQSEEMLKQELLRYEYS
jgi:CRP-like cAMP-binding protein